MKYITHRAMKTFTRKALLVSMILHVFLLITLFYFSISDQSLVSIKDKLDVTISTVPKQPLSKKPMKAPTPQIRQTKVYEVAKIHETEVETIKPHIMLQPHLAPTNPIETDQPRLKQTETAPDVEVNVSTALKELRQVEDGLSSKEAAHPILGGSLGTKRSGSPGIQRTPIRSTLDIVETTGVGDTPTQITDFQENKPSLPHITFGNVMKTLADEIAETSGGGPIDVVFVIDASGSMGDNISAVANHLSEMIDVYKSSNIDYELGLTEFNTRFEENNINILQLTKDLSKYKREINNIRPGKDENALDAIEKTVYTMEFRATSKKHLILVTDEPLTSIENNTLRSTIDACREFGIYVNVLGLNIDGHKKIAIETDGKWHAIPENPKQSQNIRIGGSGILPLARNRAMILRKAKWSHVQRIGKFILNQSVNSPVDIIVFIDGSESMVDKLPKFYPQLEAMVRDWDNALIDYQMGVVSFRMRGSVKTVNVYDPPQSIERIQKILQLPCKTDENLLHAISDGLRKIQLRPDAKTHLIIVTDEPVANNAPSLGVIQYLVEQQVRVSVVGTFDDFQIQVAQKTGGVWVPIPEGNTTNHTYW